MYATRVANGENKGFKNIVHDSLAVGICYPIATDFMTWVWSQANQPILHIGLDRGPILVQ